MQGIDEDGIPKEMGDVEVQNEILFVLDSCGWREFKRAKTPNIDKLGRAEPAMAPSFYTAPSTHCMFRGLVPQPLNRTFWPYGKYCRAENSIIPLTYEKHGYHTYMMSQNPITTNRKWETEQEVISFNPYFKHFNDKTFDIDSKRLIKWFLKRKEEPYWAFFITMRTHTPYDNKDKKNSTQIRAIEKVDRNIKLLFDGLKKQKHDTRIIICGDHAEAWSNGGKKNEGHNPRYWSKYCRENRIERLLKVPLVVGKL